MQKGENKMDHSKEGKIEIDHNDAILIQLKEKYGWQLKYLKDEDLRVIQDVSNACLDVYKHQMLSKCMFPYAETEEVRVKYSLYRMMHFLEATTHDKKYLLEFDKLGKGTELHKAFKDAYPKIGFFVAQIKKRLGQSKKMTNELLDRNEEMSYWLMECHEKLTIEAGLEPPKQTSN